MLVKELIEALTKCNQDATVLGYDSNEEASTEIHTVMLETKDNCGYCKGDHILTYEEFPNGTVTISDCHPDYTESHIVASDYKKNK